MEAAWGPIAPNFTYSATALTQALDPQCQAKAQRDHVAEEWRSAAEGKPQAGPGTPGEYILPRSSKPAEAKPQQNPKKKKKTQIRTHTKHRDSHRSKVTRSTSTLRLHKTSPGTDNTTAPARRKQEGKRSKSLSVQLQKRYQRGRPPVGSQLGFFFFFSFFKLSFISNV